MNCNMLEVIGLVGKGVLMWKCRYCYPPGGLDRDKTKSELPVMWEFTASGTVAFASQPQHSDKDWHLATHALPFTHRGRKPGSRSPKEKGRRGVENRNLTGAPSVCAQPYQ